MKITFKKLYCEGTTKDQFIAFIKGNVTGRKVGNKHIVTYRDAISNKTKTVLLNGLYFVV